MTGSDNRQTGTPAPTDEVGTIGKKEAADEGHETARRWRGRMAYVGVLIVVGLVIYATLAPGRRFEVEPIKSVTQNATGLYEPGAAAQHVIDEVHEIMATARGVTTHHSDPITGETTVDEGPNNDAMRITVRTGGSTTAVEFGPGLSSFTLEEYALDFTVPAVGISLKATTAYLRELFRLSTRVSGELISVGPADNVVLRMRVDGRRVPRVCAMERPGRIRQVLHYGARELLCAIEPLTLAAYFYATRDLSGMRRLIAVARANQAGGEDSAQARLLTGHLAGG